MDDLIDEYYMVGTHSQGGNIPIKIIEDCPLSNVAFMIEKVAVLVMELDLPYLEILFSYVCTPGLLYTCSPTLGFGEAPRKGDLGATPLRYGGWGKRP